MHRWVLPCVMLLAGCLGGPAASDDNAADGRDGPDVPADDAPPGDSPREPTAAPQVPAGPAEWFLHARADCAEEPCNCGLVRVYMDREDAADDCDGRGGRPFLQPAEGFVLAETWTAEDGAAAWPAGTQMDGRLYVTTDVESAYDLFLVLASGSVELARTEVQHVTARDAGFGLTYTEVPFSATFSEPVALGSKLRLELHIDFAPTATSYFIGYEGDHVSRFVLTPAA